MLLVGFIIRILDSYYQFLKKIDKQSLNKPPDCNAFVVTDLNLKSPSFSNKVCRKKSHTTETTCRYVL